MSTGSGRVIGARIDIETRSSVDIKSHGVYRYTESPDFAVLIICFTPIRQYNDGSIRLGRVRSVDLDDPASVAQFKRLITEPRFQKHAFNAAFERVALSRWLGTETGTYLDPENWHCSAVRANVNGIFGSLDEVARAVRSPIQKDSEGKRLIRLFSIPDRKAGGFHVTSGKCWCGSDHTSDFAKFVRYCETDVMTEAMVAAAVPDIPALVQAEYEMDQRINDNGVRHFKGLAERAVAQVEVEKDRLMGELKVLTGLDNPNSIQQMQRWLAEQDYEMNSLNKLSREEALADPLIPPQVAQALTLKGAASLSSVAKHKAALKTRCSDGRIRGSLQFYGAHTGREAGRGIQPQNLPRYEAPKADRIRLLTGSAGADAPEIAKGTVRASLVPSRGHVFVVCDYNAIEARVLAGLAGERWAMDEFRGAGKIYEATAAMMFGVDKAQLVAALKACGKCGRCANCEARGRGKVSCIAEGQLVLTNRGEVPIEQVSRNDLVWDGVTWVSHEGVVYLGTKEVITHDGLTATPDHRVWCTAGDGTHIAFGDAAARNIGLVQSGSGRHPIEVDSRYRDRAEVHPTEAPERLRSGSLRGVLSRVLVRLVEHTQGDGWLRVVRRNDSSDTGVAGSSVDCAEAAMHQPERSRLPELWRTRDRVPVSFGAGSRAVVDGELPGSGSFVGVGSDQQRRALRTEESPAGYAGGSASQPAMHQPVRVRPAILALRGVNRATAALLRLLSGGDSGQGSAGGRGEAQGVATDRVTTRVYDLLNAGPRNRYTVQGRLVHNCLALGYAGGAGALVTMGAESAGIDIGNYTELHRIWEAAGKPGKFHEWERDLHDYPELIRLRDLYRDASPMTTRFWKHCGIVWDAAALHGRATRFGDGGVLAMVRDGKHNRMVLPSGRSIWYRFARSYASEKNPERIDRRTFIGKSAGVGHTRTETHNGKITENVVQAVARDVLFDLLMKIQDLGRSGWPGKPVLHVHDEVVLEVPEGKAEEVLADTIDLMATPPDWGKFLIVKGEGDIMERYGK